MFFFFFFKRPLKLRTFSKVFWGSTNVKMQLHRPVPLGAAGVVAVECGGLRLSVRRRDGDAAAVGQQHHTETQTQQQAQQQVVVPVRHLGDTPARHVTSETPAVSRHNVMLF